MDLIIVTLRHLPGICVLLGVAWLMSERRRAVNVRLVIAGMALQVVLAGLILRIPYADQPVAWLARLFVVVLGFTDAGTGFVFGWLAGGPGFWDAVNAGIGMADGMPRFGLVFAFKVIPAIIFFSGLTSVLYYLGILQKVVYGCGWLLQRTMGLSGAESLAAAANIFIGQSEAPLVVKPYVARMTRSELLCLLSGGMATIAGSVFGAFVWMLGGNDPVAQQLYAQHLLTASLLSAPAAIVCAKILVPETEDIDRTLRINNEELGANVFEALTQGALQGLQMALQVCAMLIAVLAVIALLNAGLYLIGDWTGLNLLLDGWLGGGAAFTMETMLGLLFAPVAWLIGVPWVDSMAVGQLLGVKLVANEFVAYQQMGELLQRGGFQHLRSSLVATYGLCGFANFSSMGILIACISVLAPGRRAEASRLVLRALLAGTLACLLTAAVAGLFIAN
jgi:concentrative nucleoside transporter, CNT family